jgi:hypothetical protein
MIKKVGPTTILEKHRATCHCGAVVLELSLPDGIVNPRRCNCSICRRKGAIFAFVPLSGLRVVEGAEVLRVYQFNTMAAKHYFCSKHRQPMIFAKADSRMTAIGQRPRRAR